MKRLSVTIKLEMEVHDDWELHATSGAEVISIGDGQFLDMTFEPMLTDDPEGTWTNSADDDFMNQVLDMVVSEDVQYDLKAIQ